MNDYTTFFNPELESILQEIARNPKAKLLKVPSSGQLICATHDSRVSIAAPGLTSAEVELLEVHREELGELLKQRCITEFFADPIMDTRLHRSVDANHRLEVRDEAHWRRDTERFLKLPLVDERCQFGMDVLIRCVDGDVRAASIAQLATAMMRVTSSDQSFVYMATELLDSGSYSGAIKAYRHAQSRGLSPLLDAYCYEGVAVALWELGRGSEAHDSIQLAVSQQINRPMPLMNSIIISARIGRFEETAAACKALDDIECDDDSAIRFVSSRPDDRDEVKAMIPLTEEVETGVAKLMENFGGVSREVLRAVTQ